MGLETRLKMRRKQMGLSQEQLGNLVDFHVNTVRRWENGSRSPDAGTLQKLAQVLNTTTGYLLGETENPARTEGNAPASKAVQLPESNVRFADVTWVPVVDGAITVCCGTGTAYAEDVEWNVVGRYPVPTTDLMGFSWALKDGGFRIITVEGDSMAPRIEDGDQVLFADTELLNGDLGLVQYRDRYMIRGVFFEGDSIRLQALNKEYDPIIVTPDDLDKFCILGKVLLKVAIEKLNGLW